MIVSYLNIIGISIDEPETDSQLLIYGYSILPLSGSMKRMEAIAWRHSEVVECCGPLYILQTPDSPSNQIRRKAFRFACIEKPLGFLVGKCP
jgi:hypothetical protein